MVEDTTDAKASREEIGAFASQIYCKPYAQIEQRQLDERRAMRKINDSFDGRCDATS